MFFEVITLKKISKKNDKFCFAEASKREGINFLKLKLDEQRTSIIH